MSRNIETKAKILLVDNVSENLQVLGYILDKAGFETSFAVTSRQAMEFVSIEKPDLILLDINLPDFDGYQLCKTFHLDEETSHIPVIFLTSNAGKEEIVTGLNAGAVDYVTKPFNSHELLARINTHLELKFGRETIYEQNQKLKELNATKNKFFNIIAHDLKNPFHALLVISNYLNSKLRKIDMDELESLVSQIQESSKSGFNLLQKLLDWARTQTDSICVRPEQLKLLEIVNENIQVLKAQAKNKNITLNINVSPETNILVDRFMIGTMLDNLVSNAIKFTHRNGAVEIFAKDQESHVEVHIRDNGVGIPPEKLESLFLINNFASTWGTEKEQGTGLGLVLCKEFVEKNSGTISVKSSLGEGSTFILTFPKN